MLKNYIECKDIFFFDMNKGNRKGFGKVMEKKYKKKLSPQRRKPFCHIG